MSASKSRRVVRRFASVLASGVVAFAMVVSGASASQAATTTVDGSLALDLVDGSRLLAIESYHDKLYEITAGPLNTTVAADSSFSAQNNLAATYDPTADLVYFLTNAFSGCFLKRLTPTHRLRLPSSASQIAVRRCRNVGGSQRWVARRDFWRRTPHFSTSTCQRVLSQRRGRYPAPDRRWRSTPRVATSTSAK
jgi:hypothetical protein